MFRVGVVLVALLSTVGNAGAQTTKRLAWNQPNATAAEAATFTYKYYPDGAAVGIVLPDVRCEGVEPVVCSAVFPVFTPGAHALTVSASNAAGEGPKSAPFSFTLVAVPSAPANVRIQ